VILIIDKQHEFPKRNYKFTHEELSPIKFSADHLIR